MLRFHISHKQDTIGRLSDETPPGRSCRVKNVSMAVGLLMFSV